MDLCPDHTEEDKRQAIPADNCLFSYKHLIESEPEKIYFDKMSESFFFDLNCSQILPIGSKLYNLSFDSHGLLGDTPPIVADILFMATEDRVIYQLNPALFGLFERVCSIDLMVTSIKKKLNA